jgi:hypothetical protein
MSWDKTPAGKAASFRQQQQQQEQQQEKRPTGSKGSRAVSCVQQLQVATAGPVRRHDLCAIKHGKVVARVPAFQKSAAK